MYFNPPAIKELQMVSQLPTELRKNARSEWSDRNLNGETLDAFLEGPVFDKNGNLFVVDIPFGRILKLASSGSWSVIAEYDGWPNGMKALPRGTFLVADHKLGLIEIDPASGTHEVLVSSFEERPFFGLNDLTLASDGSVFFTDQGCSGLQSPHGRLFRLNPDKTLTLILDGIPSPNGLVLAPDEKTLFLAVTRANAIWRVPLPQDGVPSKVGLFIQLSGGIGPDGLALSPADHSLLIAHPGLGVWQFDQSGKPKIFWALSGNAYTTNLVHRPNTKSEFFVTESKQAAVLRFEAQSKF